MLIGYLSIGSLLDAIVEGLLMALVKKEAEY